MLEDNRDKIIFYANKQIEDLKKEVEILKLKSEWIDKQFEYSEITEDFAMYAPNVKITFSVDISCPTTPKDILEMIEAKLYTKDENES